MTQSSDKSQVRYTSHKNIVIHSLYCLTTKSPLVIMKYKCDELQRHNTFQIIWLRILL